MKRTAIGLLAMIALLVSACGSQDNSAAPGGGGTGTGGGTGSVVNPPAGVVDNSAGFYVDYVKSPNYTYVMHKGNATVTTKCTAAQNELATCYLEGQELDVYFNGASLQYNVPSNLCAYFLVSPYYFYKWQSGPGPANVQVDTDKNGNTGIDVNSDGFIDGPSQTCAFDYTGIKGPNCCTGNYSKAVRNWDPSVPGYKSGGVQNNIPWGGDPSQCIAGPAVDTQPKNIANFPVPVIYYVNGTGINGLYAIKAPISSQMGTDLYVANYWPGQETGVAPPAAMLPTEPYYDFVCLDRAHEFQSEIRVVIRKWNTSPEFANMLADPSQYAKAGFENAPWNTQPNDDWWGWFHFMASYPQFGL